jgi:hypothetical protein
MTKGMRVRTAALVASFVLLAIVAIERGWSGTSFAVFAYWFTLCLAGELLWVRLPLGSATISMASCFNFAALLLLTRGEAMGVTVASTLMAELAILRKPPVRALFNAAQTALAVWCAWWAYRLAGGGAHAPAALLSSLHVAPFVAAAALYYIVNRTAVTMAIASSTGLGFVEAWRRNFGDGYELLAAGAVLSLGAMLATLYSAIGMGGALFVVLPLALAGDGIRRRARQPGPAPAGEGEKRAA